MKINNIAFHNEGYVYCKSNFYTAQDGLSSETNYTFSTGVNKLFGEIDSGIWATSYLLSMYNQHPEDFILFEPPEVFVNDKMISLNDLSEFSCYMDKSYSLFGSGLSVKNLVMQGITKNQLNLSPSDVRNLFLIDSERFERSLSGVGNEVYKAMAAIGYCHNKQIFCFPWMSARRFNYYHSNITRLLDILNQLEKIVILPTEHSKE